MALSSSIRNMIDRVGGLNGPGDGCRANYLYSASGLAADIKKVQAGELYIDAINEVTATGFFDYNYAINEIPRIMTEWYVNPSGNHMHISASGEDHFVVTFTDTSGNEISPVVDVLVATPHFIGTWLAIL